ncbi:MULTISPECIES: ATP-binding protein [Pseudofrankia]|uniref:ATP-binding protein n=1 Tax=Pseudofrankia TaxID=2994363 RepID=UPI000234BEEE|nr:MULTISPECIES: BTAD domain-containing putative transcriptional regulator [Pseudofrankia]OHV36028.1 LuxR family transcriptional regulator [Pseudofrankia sp. EUN1h]
MSIELTLLSRVAYRDREVSGRRLRSLLALLAGDLAAGCGLARLVDGIWPDEPPENPAKALQILVSRARRQLGAEAVVRTPTGYCLTLRSDQVDAAVVPLRVAACERHTRAGDHAAALADAEAGLALWDGVPEEDDAGLDDPLAALRALRAPEYWSLTRARALALSRLDRLSDAARPLAQLYGRRPRDEEVLLELLRCEVAVLGPAAALARYEEHRRALRAELGVDPGAALRAAYDQLLGQAAPPVRRGVRNEPNPLLGRDADVRAVTRLLATSRVTSIVGPGGLGKTRLAHAVSRLAEQRVVHVVELAAISGDDEVAAAVASVLGIAENPRTSPGRSGTAGTAGSSTATAGSSTATAAAVGPAGTAAAIARALGSGTVLLVLDNCEHVVAGVADLARALVSASPNLRVLTTSRAPLGLSSESVYPLPELDPATSAELFGQRARAARPGLDLSTAAVEELCRRLDGLPLAVELAAARVRVMSVAEISRRLDDRFALLRGTARDAPERHHTLSAVVEWSWNLLEPPARAAMRTLSVFPGGFTAETAARLLGESEGGDAVPAVVEHLVDQSLLKVDDAPSGTRFRMLETVREFGEARRNAAGETERVVAEFLAWARAFGVAHHADPFGAEPAPAVGRIRDEQDNLLRALRLGLAAGDGATVAATAGVLAALWTIESNYTPLAALIDDTSWLLSHYRPEPALVEVTRAAAALATAYLFSFHGPCAVRSLVVLRRLPAAPADTVGRAAAAVLRAAPRLDAAGLAALCASAEPLVAGIARIVLSYVLERDGDLAGAEDAGRGALQLVRVGELPWARMMAHGRLAELAMNSGRGDEALSHLRAASGIPDGIEDLADAFGVGRAMALAHLQAGAVDDAERCLLPARARAAPDADTAAYRSFDHAVRGEFLFARGEIDAALAAWRLAVDAANSTSLPGVHADPGLSPWALEIKAVAVVAHARHGQLGLLPEATDEVVQLLPDLLTHPESFEPSYLTGAPLCGALALALAMVTLDRGRRDGDAEAAGSGARLVALAERFGYLRQFQPTMSLAAARDVVLAADRSAYEDAVTSYADLGPAELRVAALAAVLAAHAFDRPRASPQLEGSRSNNLLAHR